MTLIMIVCDNDGMMLMATSVFYYVCEAAIWLRGELT
jgi:hypothetical protein